MNLAYVVITNVCFPKKAGKFKCPILIFQMRGTWLSWSLHQSDAFYAVGITKYDIKMKCQIKYIFILVVL